jgi:hypothetical protein
VVALRFARPRTRTAGGGREEEYRLVLRRGRIARDPPASAYRSINNGPNPGPARGGPPATSGWGGGGSVPPDRGTLRSF